LGLKLDCKRSGSTYRIGLAGELDLSNVPELRDALEVSSDETAPERLVIDLTQLDFIDSTGIALLVEVNRIVQKNRTCLEIVKPEDGNVHRLLELTGLYEQLPFTTSAR
jgi:anti-anti-sigma factor